MVASCMFGAIYFIAPLLAPLQGDQIFGWRMLMTVPFTTVWLLYSGQGPAVVALLQRARRSYGLVLGLLLSAALAGLQLWLFVWAPLQGHALPVSLGYFLLPLALVIAGRVVFGERLNAAQISAAALAALGVFYELWRAGGMAWSTWVVLLGYPLYFVLRRKLHTNHLAGHWLDVMLLVPCCVWLVLRAVPQLPNGGWDAIVQTPMLHWAVPCLGLLSAVALGLYMAASRMLPLGLFGLLSYVEPILLVLAALLMGERIQAGQEPMYVLIAAGVALLALDAVRQMRSQPQQGQVATDAGAAKMAATADPSTTAAGS